MAKMPPLTIRMDLDQLEALNCIAEECDRSVSHVLRSITEAYLLEHGWDDPRRVIKKVQKRQAVIREIAAKHQSNTTA